MLAFSLALFSASRSSSARSVCLCPSSSICLRFSLLSFTTRMLVTTSFPSSFSLYSRFRLSTICCFPLLVSFSSMFSFLETPPSPSSLAFILSWIRLRLAKMRSSRSAAVDILSPSMTPPTLSLHSLSAGVSQDNTHPMLRARVSCYLLAVLNCIRSEDSWCWCPCAFSFSKVPPLVCVWSL